MSIYVENLLLTIGVFIILGWACYLPLLGGQLFNGAIYCAALSAYFAAYTTKVLGWPIALGFLSGVAFSGFFSLGMAFLLAPLTMFQMAVVTMALVFIFQTVFHNLEFLGGAIGISGIPRTENLLLICAVSVLISLILITRLSKSRWGRALEAVEHDRPMAEAMGVDVIRMSIVLQVVSGVLGGTAGVVFAFNLGTIHPDVFGFGQLLYCVLIVFVGGRHTPWGTLLMAPILWLIPEFFPSAIAQYKNIFFAAVIIVSLLLRPDGVITKGLVTTVERRLKRLAGARNLISREFSR